MAERFTYLLPLSSQAFVIALTGHNGISITYDIEGAPARYAIGVQGDAGCRIVRQATRHYPTTGRPAPIIPLSKPHQKPDTSNQTPNMSWARVAVAALERGETVKVRPRGHSMTGKVNDGDLVTIAPCDVAQLRVGDIVLARVKGAWYLHLIKAIEGGRFLIGNNRGGINGWTRNVLGKAIAVER